MRLQSRGFAVVPCEGKRAVVKQWDKKPLTREELREALAGTNRNIGIALNLTDLIDVECDSEGAEVALLTLFGGEVPPTPTWTSKRGKHRRFRRPAGLPEKATVELDGIEFRIGNGKGAMSVVPPSVHPETGRRYVWLHGLSLFDVEPAELPPEVVERLRAPEAPQPEPPGDGDIPEGRRNDELFRIACKLCRAGLKGKSVEAAEGALGMKSGDFLRAYAANRQTANEVALESSPVVTALLKMLNDKKSRAFEGTATQLLDRLAVGQDTRVKGWPRTAKDLSGMLSRLSPNLRAIGLTMEQDRKDNRKLWRIKAAPQPSQQAGPSASSQSTQETGSNLGPGATAKSEKERPQRPQRPPDSTAKLVPPKSGLARKIEENRKKRSSVST